MKADILIVGSGCAGLYCAMQLPRDKSILIISKSQVESSCSYLAQGGICTLKNEEDYDSFFEDTMRAGHYENDERAVEIMIRSSADVIKDLLSYGVEFNKESSGELAFTKEGAHSASRILYHKDITGEEITKNLYKEVKKLPNVRIMEYTAMLDIIAGNNTCYGVVARDKEGGVFIIKANYTVLATGGIGGLYPHSTNFRHLTGDAVAIAMKHGLELKDINYVQMHPTTLYSDKEEDRSFLISESVRGEGAKLYNKNMKAFVNELLPRDLLTKEVLGQMKKDQTEFVWEDLRSIPEDELTSHFPNIVDHCKNMGYDVTKECIPVVPAQHYFMGGIKVDYESRTSMERLYAIGETACTGVHGRNRLASNSLLESLVFSERSAVKIAEEYSEIKLSGLVYERCDLSRYSDPDKLSNEYKSLLLNEIGRLDREEKIKKTSEKRDNKYV